jgi:dihydrofolate synthase/folylpolyglutamate synthase
VEAIAGEKAGIIKPGSVAVLAQQQVEAAEVLLRRAAMVGAAVAREGLDFGVLDREVALGGQQVSFRGLRGTYEDVFLPLFGDYQAGNAACSLAAVEAFAGAATAGAPDAALAAGDLPGEPTVPGMSREALDPELVRQAFAKVSAPGRLEILRRGPTVIADASHNPAGMAATVGSLLDEFTFTRLIGVLAVSADKDAGALLDELEPVLAEVVVTRNSSGRSMTPDELAEVAEEVFGEDRVRVAQRMDEAIDIAIALADEAAEGDLPGGGGGVLITGSVVTAGDAKLLLSHADTAEPPNPPSGPTGRHSFTAADLS